MVELRVVAPTGTPLGPEAKPTPIEVVRSADPRVMALALTFHEAIEKTEYYQRLERTNDPLARSTLASLAESTCHCRLDEHPAERDAIRAVLLDPPVAGDDAALAASDARRRAFASFLTPLDRLPATGRPRRSAARKRRRPEKAPYGAVLLPSCCDGRMKVQPDGRIPAHHPQCFGCGPENAAGIGLQMRADGDLVRAEVVFDHRHQGAPGLAHGGAVAAAFDDLFGGLLVMLEMPDVTANLNVDFRAPVPLGIEVALHAHPISQEGRKLRFQAYAEHGGQRLAEATALFLRVDLSHFEGADAPIPDSWRAWASVPDGHTGVSHEVEA